MRPTSRTSLLLATALLAASAHATLGVAAPVPAGAQAAPSLSATPTTIPSDQATAVTVSGRSYLKPPGGNFGGVYVFFGWVQPGGAWGPSHRNSTDNSGVFGHTYAYAGDGGDADTRDDGSGRMSFVSFTSDGESGAATDVHMDAAGNWTTTLIVPGPTFQTIVGGQARQFDCRQVQCGIFTIGAHGISSRTNEHFVPINFTEPATSPQPGAQAPTGGADPSAPAPGAVDPGVVAPGPVEVVEEIVEVRSPFEDAAGGTEVAASAFPGLDAGAGAPGSAVAAGVPGATGSPVVVASSGSHTFTPESTSVANTGGIPRWFLPAAVLAVLAVAGLNTWRRRRTAGGTEVIA